MKRAGSVQAITDEFEQPQFSRETDLGDLSLQKERVRKLEARHQLVEHKIKQLESAPPLIPADEVEFNSENLTKSYNKLKALFYKLKDLYTKAKESKDPKDWAKAVLATVGSVIGLGVGIYLGILLAPTMGLGFATLAAGALTVAAIAMSGIYLADKAFDLFMKAWDYFSPEEKEDKTPTMKPDAAAQHDIERQEALERCKEHSQALALEIEGLKTLIAELEDKIEHIEPQLSPHRRPVVRADSDSSHSQAGLLFSMASAESTRGGGGFFAAQREAFREKHGFIAPKPELEHKIHKLK